MIAAMRDRASTAEMLVLWEEGLISCLEMTDVAWEACWDRPDLQRELIRQFQQYPDERVARSVGIWLAEIAAERPAK
jgi:hypothetical protein